MKGDRAMHKYQNIDKAILNRCTEKGWFKSVSELETKRREYFQSEYYLKNRRRVRFIPPDDIPSLTLLKNFDEIEMVTMIIVDELQKEVSGNMPENLFKQLVGNVIDETKVFPPPMDIYVSHSVASKIFEISTERLTLYRETGLLRFIKEKGEFNYPWTRLQELFS